VVLPEIADFWEIGSYLRGLVCGPVVNDENFEIRVFKGAASVQTGVQIGCAIIGADNY